jgi:hypothetical protein
MDSRETYCLYGFKRNSKEIEIGKPFFRKD